MNVIDFELVLRKYVTSLRTTTPNYHVTACLCKQVPAYSLYATEEKKPPPFEPVFTAQIVIQTLAVL